jgi:hypothetical protein
MSNRFATGLFILGAKEEFNENTFIKLLNFHQIPFKLHDWLEPFEINEILSDFGGIVILGSNYPEVLPSNERREAITELISKALHEAKPIFAEYFPYLPAENKIQITTKSYHRIIVRDVASPLLQGLEPNQIFEVHSLPVLSLDIQSSFFDRATELLSLAKVAGVYHAIYGLPKETFLVLLQKESLVFSTIRISAFDPMEFRLKIHWETLLLNIIRYLCHEWHPLPAVVPRIYDNRGYFAAYKELNPAARIEKYRETVQRGLNWFIQSGVLRGDNGDRGVYEGFSSSFDPNGRKTLRRDEFLGQLCQRGDCTADSAYCFWLGGHLSADHHIPTNEIARWKTIGTNLFRELYTTWQHFDNDRSIRRGFFGWYNDYYNHNVFYADDNGRCSIESLFYTYMHRGQPELSDLVRRSYANVHALHQTMGKNGHRPTRIDLHQFYPFKGRKWFRNHAFGRHSYQSPHYEGWTYAAILYGAYLLQEPSLIKEVQLGIEDYMGRFPKISVEHSVGDDFSKLLIACVMLYQCTQDPRHLSWITRIIDFFAEIQDPTTGAFPERDPHNMHARTEPTNEKYGKGESALYTSSADTITDQLYSAGFLAWALFLAAKTGKIPRAYPMLERFLDYLSAIQMRSANPQLDGVWTRGFDYHYGEPYGANGDVGWGAYCLETGWTQGPILTAFLWYLMDFNPFEPLPDHLRTEFREIFQTEQQFQREIEKTWKKQTPKPRKHPNRLSPAERDRIKQELAEWDRTGIRIAGLHEHR